MSKNKNKQNNGRNPKGPTPKKPTPRPEPTPEQEQQPVGVVAVLTLLNQVPPGAVYVLTDGSTMNTPGVPGVIVNGVREAIVKGLTEGDPEQTPDTPDEAPEQQEGDGDDEIPVEPEGADVEPAPVEGDSAPGDTVTVPVPEGVTLEQVQNVLASALGNIKPKDTERA